jgi:two-component system, NtrC family, response regulator HydG
MRVALHDEDAQRLGAMLRQHGLPEDVDLSGAGEGLHVVVVLAHAQRVASAADHWLRRFPLPDAFIAGCTASTRCQCQPETWWPASVCDVSGHSRSGRNEPARLTQCLAAARGQSTLPARSKHC